MRRTVWQVKSSWQNLAEDLREQMIRDYLPLVQFVALQIARRLPPGIDMDDLVSSGVIGLIDAIYKFEPERESKFKTYAEWRIRGAILDELRNNDRLPRSLREFCKKIAEVNHKVEVQYGRQAETGEIASVLDLSLGKFQELQSLINGDGLEFFLHDSSIVSGIQQSPSFDLERAQLRKAIEDELAVMSDNQRLVLTLYYYEGLNQKEIGAILNVTESRVCQIHKKALSTLRRRLRAQGCSAISL